MIIAWLVVVHARTLCQDPRGHDAYIRRWAKIYDSGPSPIQRQRFAGGQRQTVVTAYFSSKQLPLFAFVVQYPSCLLRLLPADVQVVEISTTENLGLKTSQHRTTLNRRLSLPMEGVDIRQSDRSTTSYQWAVTNHTFSWSRSWTPDWF